MQSNKKKRSSLIICIIVIITIIAIGTLAFINNKKNAKNNNSTINTDIVEDSLIGTFIYEENKTKYSFNDDGTGSMSSDNYSYEYKYKTEENTLSIDFARDEVHDVIYSYELKNGVLKLISKEGTVSVGEEYILKKEDE